MASPRVRNPFVTAPGTVFGFPTAPVYPGISAPDTGRFGAILVLGHNASIVVIGALEGVWPTMPRIEDLEGRELLRITYHDGSGRDSAMGCDVRHTVDIPGLTRLGEVRLTATQKRIAGKYLKGSFVGRTFGLAEFVAHDVESQWRRTHDGEALERESHVEADQSRERRAAEELRFETRLKDLTWEQLLSEDPFARWEPSPPFPPAEFRTAATARVHEACRELQAMGPKPRKPATRKVLKDLVMWFRDRDREAGYVIETEEREDIGVACEEMAHVAQQPALIEEFGAWFNWYE